MHPLSAMTPLSGDYFHVFHQEPDSALPCHLDNGKDQKEHAPQDGRVGRAGGEPPAGCGAAVLGLLCRPGSAEPRWPAVAKAEVAGIAGIASAHGEALKGFRGAAIQTNATLSLALFWVYINLYSFYFYCLCIHAI